MVHTLPDYSTKYRLTQVFGNIDNNELAVRLGCPSVYDRRGTVAFIDNFEASVLHWYSDAAPAGSSVALSTESARSGSQSVKALITSEQEGEANIARNLPGFFSDRIGIEAHIYNPGSTGYFEMRLNGYTGSKYYLAGIRLNMNTGSLYYVGTDLSYYLFAENVGIPDSYHGFYPFKIVIDISKGEYVRCLWNNIYHDLAGKRFSYDSDTTPALTSILLTYTGLGAGSQIIYIDDIIITQTEP